jgi:hypothetical protein
MQPQAQRKLLPPVPPTFPGLRRHPVHGGCAESAGRRARGAVGLGRDGGQGACAEWLEEWEQYYGDNDQGAFWGEEGGEEE